MHKILLTSLFILISIPSQAQTQVSFDIDEDNCLCFETFFTNIEFVRLETTQKSVIGPEITKVVANGQSIVIFAKDIIIFDREGRFVRKLSRGYGPQEIRLARDVTLGNTGKIHILDAKKQILIYASNGEYLKRIKIPFHCDHFEILPNGNYLLYTYDDQTTKFFLYEYKPRGKQIINHYFPAYHWGKTGLYSSSPFRKSGNTISLLHPFSDTIYNFDSNGSISKTALDFGKLRLNKDYYEKLQIDSPQKVFFEAQESSKIHRLSNFARTNTHMYFLGIKNLETAYTFAYEIGNNVGTAGACTYFVKDGIMLNKLVGGLKGSTSKAMIHCKGAFSFKRSIDDILSTLNPKEAHEFMQENSSLFKLYDTIDDNDNPIVFFIKE